jgi:hypothetical protein
MHWYCTTCRKEVEAEDGAVVACAAGTCRLQPDRRIFEPDLPAMGSTPSDEWVAVYQPRDATEADAVQEYLENQGIPALQLPGIADWLYVLDPDERQAIVHLAVPRASAAEARQRLELLLV